MGGVPHVPPFCIQRDPPEEQRDALRPTPQELAPTATSGVRKLFDLTLYDDVMLR
jgi:hypothetical protein